MILGITTLLFLVCLVVVWWRGPDADGTAYGMAATVAILTAAMTAVTGYFGLWPDHRVEAAFCGIVLAFALAFVGILRS